MSLFNKDFLKEGDQGKGDYDSSSQFHLYQDSNSSSNFYGNDSSYGSGGAQTGYGFPGYGAGQQQQQQQSRLGGLSAPGLPANQPLFNRSNSASTGGVPRPGGILGGPSSQVSQGSQGAPSMSSMLGLGGSANSSATNTPGRNLGASGPSNGAIGGLMNNGNGIAASSNGSSIFGNGSNLGSDARFSGIPLSAAGSGIGSGINNNSSAAASGMRGILGLSQETHAPQSEDDFHNVMGGLVGGLNDNDDFSNTPGFLESNGSNNSSSLLGSRTTAVAPSLLSSQGAAATSTNADFGSTNAPGASPSLFAALSTPPQPPQLQSAVPALSKDAKFGLLGLLRDVLRPPNKDIHQLALGTDLTSFGLHLSATENLYPTFTSPFTDAMFEDNKPYKVPSCYLSPNAAFKVDHLSKFSVETLFYIFYLLPRDVMQNLAAMELYRREWRYHGELKVWLKPRTQSELLQAHPSVQFVYFDPKTFEARLFNAAGRGNLSNGIVSEEEILQRLTPASLAAVTAAPNAAAAAASTTTAAAAAAAASAVNMGSTGAITGGLANLSLLSSNNNGGNTNGGVIGSALHSGLETSS